MEGEEDDGLSREETEAYSRQIILEDIGYEGQVKLKKSKVTVIGVGGLGTPTAVQLAAMGFGHIRIVDRDVVSKSDLHRQFLYDVEHIGQPKVEVAAEKLALLNPRIAIEPIADAIAPHNIANIIRDADLVIDGLDSIETRYLVNRRCVELGVPYIFGAAIESYGNVSTIMPGTTACLECFYPNIKDNDLPRCAIVGVHPPVLTAISSVQVSEAVKLVIGAEPALLNKLLYIDIRNLSFDHIDVARRNDCPVCGEKRVEETILVRSGVEAVCGRDGKGVFALTPRRNLQVDLEKVKEVLRSMKLEPKIKSRFSLTFDYDTKIVMTIFASGIALAQVRPPSSLEDTAKILSIYRSILVEGVGIPEDAAPRASPSPV